MPVSGFLEIQICGETSKFPSNELYRTHSHIHLGEVTSWKNSDPNTQNICEFNLTALLSCEVGICHSSNLHSCAHFYRLPPLFSSSIQIPRTIRRQTEWPLAQPSLQAWYMA